MRHEGHEIVLLRNDPPPSFRRPHDVAKRIGGAAGCRQLGLDHRRHEVERDELAVEMFERCPGPRTGILEHRGPGEVAAVGQRCEPLPAEFPDILPVCRIDGEDRPHVVGRLDHDVMLWPAPCLFKTSSTTG